jgi:uncharacterized protein YdeI (YjbR/CyaY-like superfamily)
MTEQQVLDARTPQQWEEWLEHNHNTAAEIWLRLLNKNAPESGMSYGEAVEIALCFGWIDSLTRGYDEGSQSGRPLASALATHDASRKIALRVVERISQPWLQFRH